MVWPMAMKFVSKWMQCTEYYRLSLWDLAAASIRQVFYHLSWTEVILIDHLTKLEFQCLKPELSELRVMYTFVCVNGDTYSGCDDVRRMETEWFADASCHRQWNDARLFPLPFPDQRAFAHCSSELPWLHYWRARRQQRYDVTFAVIDTVWTSRAVVVMVLLLPWQSLRTNFYFSCSRMQCIVISMSVMFVLCLSSRISQKPCIQLSPGFLYFLPVALARSSSDGNAIGYVLPVLWMTSWFHMMEVIATHQRPSYQSSSVSRAAFFQITLVGHSLMLVLCYSIFVFLVNACFLGRPTRLLSRPKKVGLKCLFVRVYVCRPSVHKKFIPFFWNLACR